MIREVIPALEQGKYYMNVSIQTFIDGQFDGEVYLSLDPRQVIEHIVVDDRKEKTHCKMLIVTEADGEPIYLWGSMEDVRRARKIIANSKIAGEEDEPGG